MGTDILGFNPRKAFVVGHKNREMFMSITKMRNMRGYAQKSHEELRWEDYRLHPQLKNQVNSDGKWSLATSSESKFQADKLSLATSSDPDIQADKLNLATLSESKFKADKFSLATSSESKFQADKLSLATSESEFQADKLKFPVDDINSEVSKAITLSKEDVAPKKGFDNEGSIFNFSNPREDSPVFGLDTQLEKDKKDSPNFLKKGFDNEGSIFNFSNPREDSPVFGLDTQLEKDKKDSPNFQIRKPKVPKALSLLKNMSKKKENSSHAGENSLDEQKKGEDFKEVVDFFKRNRLSPYIDSLKNAEIASMEDLYEKAEVTVQALNMKPGHKQKLLVRIAQYKANHVNKKLGDLRERDRDSEGY
ncbi:hypothetical protein AAMO2058_000323800 [Amorphochlora amoebiformis]